MDIVSFTATWLKWTWPVFSLLLFLPVVIILSFSECYMANNNPLPTLRMAIYHESSLRSGLRRHY